MFNRMEVDDMDKENVWDTAEDMGMLYEFDQTGEPETGEADGVVSIEDSFVMSMRNKGYVDLDYMSAVTGASEKNITDRLSGKAIWVDPDRYKTSKDTSVSWVSRQQLLRGNLYKKLESARMLLKSVKEMEDTVILLQKELPDMVSGQDIHINLGSSWVPPRYIERFIGELLGMIVDPDVKYDDFRGVWTIEKSYAISYVNNNFTYGTDRMSALSIIKKMLNAKPVAVYDSVPNPERDGEMRVLNRDATLEAQEKQKLIASAWQDFVHGDPQRETELQEIYMKRYGYTCSRYDGSFLELADMAPVMTPYAHQKNAIAHIILGKNTLLAHEVGSGKTLEMCAGVHELIRIGLGHRAVMVVPNTTFSAMNDTYRQLYPSDRVLAVSPNKDFTPAKRKGTLGKMKSGEYDVIIMAYSSFDMITLSKECSFARWEARLRTYRSYIGRCRTYAERSRAEAELKRLNDAYRKYRENFKDSDTACFDDLGIDILVVDEAHNYKNITIDGRVTNIVGMHAKGSKKANSMLEKVQYIQSLDSGHVVFATGTPITNSLADLYVLQRYLQPVELELCHIDHFNDWVNTFCEQQHSFEVDVDSKNFRFTTRFSKFHNLPELMAMFSEVCDFYQVSAGELKLPDFNGYNDVLVHKSDAQTRYINDLADRTDAIRSHRVRRSEDNLLKVTVDGRKCALDIRLVRPDETGDNTENKCGSCADNVARIYWEKPNTTQIVFCDISTPRNGFNVYDELRGELIKRNIPDTDIAYIHDAATDAQRKKIEKSFNDGKVRILIGSTMKLGIGANVQERLIAVHHLDQPWRPADMVQRQGRILRQGNLNSEVFIYRYVTESSFDSYTWQILENKQKFIAQFLSGTMSAVHREETDTADTVLNYSEIKALAIGDPLIRQRVDVSNSLERARINQRQRRKQLISQQDWLDMAPIRLRAIQRRIKAMEYDAGYYNINKHPVTKDDRSMFGDDLMYALENNSFAEYDRFFENYQGFDVMLPKKMDPAKPYVLLRSGSGNSYEVKMAGGRGVGCSKRIDNVLEHLPQERERAINEREQFIKQIEMAQSEIQRGNEYDVEVDRLASELADIDKTLKGDIAV